MAERPPPSRPVLGALSPHVNISRGSGRGALRHGAHAARGSCARGHPCLRRRRPARTVGRGRGNLGQTGNGMRSQHLQVGTSENWRPARRFGSGETREVVTPGALWDARARGRGGLPRWRLEEGYAALLPSMLPPSPSSPVGGRVVCRALQRDQSGSRRAGFLLSSPPVFHPLLQPHPSQELGIFGLFINLAVTVTPLALPFEAPSNA